MRLGVVDERLGAVAALQQERLTPCNGAEALLQPVDLRRERDRRHALEHRADVGDVLGVGPLGLLRGRAGQCVVEPGPQIGGKRGQLGQHLDRCVDRPVHDVQG